MIARSALLTFRINRFETTIVVGAVVLSVLVSALVIGALNATGWTRCQTEEALSTTAFCRASLAGWLFRIADLSVRIVPVFPVVAGILVGGPLIARELETGTARLAWSLGPSRLQWFVQRSIPALAMVFAAALVIGLTAEALLHLLEPSIDLDRSFANFRVRGLLVGMQALLVASIALAFGAILGRTVPTFVLTLILVGGIVVGIDKVEAQSLTSEALVTSEFTWGGGDLYLNNRFQLPDGELVTYQELADLHPEINEIGFSEEQYPNVVLYIPGSRYHDIERREAAALALISAAFIGLSAVVMLRRRPR